MAGDNTPQNKHLPTSKLERAATVAVGREATKARGGNWGAKLEGGRRAGWHKMLRLYMGLTRHPQIDKLVSRYSNWGKGWSDGSERISLEDFRAFWREQQRNKTLDLGRDGIGDDEEATQLFDLAAPADGSAYLTPADFQRLLLSPHNSAVDARQRRVHMDMSQPLSHYMINSSHNTFLTGNQMTSPASADMYRRVLLMGCRSLEIDCYDGPDGEPIVYHGHTATKPVAFRKVVQAIKETAFPTVQTSTTLHSEPFPIVLSLEMHCSLPQQETLASILQDTFGERLQLPIPVAPGDKHAPGVPAADSPLALRGKVVIKGKRLPEKEGDTLTYACGAVEDEPTRDTCDTARDSRYTERYSSRYGHPAAWARHSSTCAHAIPSLSLPQPVRTHQS